MRKISVIERIKKEIGKEVNEHDVLVFKISPNERDCCCTNCWYGTWSYINNNLKLNHPITHEDGALVTLNNVDFVLEDHESGPEIIVWIEAGSALINMVSAIITLICVIIDKRKIEKPSSTFSIKKIIYKNGKPKEKIIIKIPQNMDRKAIKKLLKENVKV